MVKDWSSCPQIITHGLGSKGPGTQKNLHNKEGPLGEYPQALTSTQGCQGLLGEKDREGKVLFCHRGSE